MISTVEGRANGLADARDARCGRTLIFGSGSPTLNAAVALELAGEGADVVIAANGSQPTLADRAIEGNGRVRSEALTLSDDPGRAIGDAVDLLGGLDIVVNLHAPSPGSDLAELLDYPRQLLRRSILAAEAVVAHSTRGSIVSQCFLPAIYAGTPLEDVMPAVKGAVTGVTRTLCRRFARLGLRANYVQTGLIDLPELKSELSPLVRGQVVPVGRWGTAEDVAALIAFLAMEDHYMTGQVVLLDGGLTAGLTGT